jgi:hypothetical protein
MVHQFGVGQAFQPDVVHLETPTWFKPSVAANWVVFQSEWLFPKPLSPVLGGERGWGEGAGISRDSLPSPPTPLQEYRERGAYGTASEWHALSMDAMGVGRPSGLITPFASMLRACRFFFEPN